MDPTLDQWKELIDVILAKKHFVFLDSAYQGFASGDLDKDAQALRLMERLGVPFLACQSFAKVRCSSPRLSLTLRVTPTSIRLSTDL